MRTTYKYILSVGFFLCLACLMAFFPDILSSRYGTNLFLQTVKDKTHMETSVNKLRLTWLGPQVVEGLKLHNEDLDISFDQLEIHTPLWYLSDSLQPKRLGKGAKNFNLENGSVSLHKQGISPAEIKDVHAAILLHEEGADMTLSGNSLQNELQGDFTLKTQIKHLDDPFSNLSLQLKTNNLSTNAIDALAHVESIFSKFSLVTILGETFQSSLSLIIQNQAGTLDLSLHAPNVDGEIHGKISNDIFRLSSPVTMILRVTPEISRIFLREINPLFLTAIQAKNPLQLRIETNRFQCPIRSFSIETLHIHQATLDVGQVLCSTKNSLSSILGFLKNQSLQRQNKNILVWFSPLSFRLSQGIIHAGRMDALLADEIHVCVWGNINLKKDLLDMSLGLPADTLRSSLGLKRIDPNYVLKIPLTGSTNNPQLDTGIATAKIAALIASQKAPG